MMRILCLAVAVLFLLPVAANAQELFIRSDKYSTELYLKLDTTDIKSVEKRKESVVIFFQKKIRKPFTRVFDDKFIKSIDAENDTFTVNIAPNSEFTVVNDISGLKVIATKKKTDTEIFSSYGIGNPLITKDGGIAEDKVQENALGEADKLIALKQFSQAANVLNNVLSSSKNDFYRQEALYRLGQVYVLMAEYDSEYLARAAAAFDDFVKLYPDNFRVPDALLKSAEAKEEANQLFEAIFTYQQIYDSVPDLESKRTALTRMANLYTIVGQLDKAIDMYKVYLKNFRTDEDKINSEIGQIYYDQKELNLAYEYFAALDIDKIVKDRTNTAKRFFSIAKTMETKKRFDDALKLYSAIFENTPDAPQSNEAIFNSAEILQKTGRNDEADRLLLRLKQLFPDKLSGQQSTIAYAKKYLNSKSADYWKEFFADLMARTDEFGLQQEARYMMIKALHRENRMAETLAAIEAFLTDYSGSPYYREVNGLREDFMYGRAQDTFKSGDFVKAEPMLHTLLQDYPESKYKTQTESMLTDIRFAKAEDAYEAKRYKNTMTQVESYIVEMPQAKDMARWLALYDDAMYRDLAVMYGSDDFPATRVKAREYLSNFPKGKYVKQTSEMLENSLRRPMEALFKSGSFADIVKLYEANAAWVNDWQNKKLKNDMTAIAGLAVYHMGSPSKARVLYSEIKPPNTTPNYVMLGLLSGDINVRPQINQLSADDFRYLISETETANQDAALAMLSMYTKDPKLTAQLEYGILKNTASDAKRQDILTQLYKTITSNQAARFDGSNEIYLDMGMLHYRKNDFKNAVIPLKQYTDIHQEKDEKRAEALYYLGKSFVGMNDRDRGFQYYNEIINTMPNSIYAGIARSELDEDSWKKSLNKF